MLSALSEGNVSTATRSRFRSFLETHALSGCRSNWEVNLNPLPGRQPPPRALTWFTSLLDTRVSSSSADFGPKALPLSPGLGAGG